MELAQDARVARQLESVIQRIKRSMRYRGSYSTHDILDSLVVRWVQSGEWERLKQLAPEARHVGESVRRFILDRFAQSRRRGERVDHEPGELALPDDASLVELVADAELRCWIDARISELADGVVDARVRIRIEHPEMLGRMLRQHLDGWSQRQIADAAGTSLGFVNKRLSDGTRYLVLMQSIENGLA